MRAGLKVCFEEPSYEPFGKSTCEDAYLYMR